MTQQYSNEFTVDIAATSALESLPSPSNVAVPDASLLLTYKFGFARFGQEMDILLANRLPFNAIA